MIIGYCPDCGHEIRWKDFFYQLFYECPSCNCLVKLISILVDECATSVLGKRDINS